MKISINNIELIASQGESLIEVARKEGIPIPSLCYAKGMEHKSSCMVCAVKNCKTGQMIPSCSTLVEDGMQIETDSDDVRQTRTLSLELLLSDHRADCEAPCSIACPAGLDIAKMNRLYDAEKYEEALFYLRDQLVIPATLCYICNAPCERICRRNDIDHTVPIREIKKALVQKTNLDKIYPVKDNGQKIAILGSDPFALSAAYNLQKMMYAVTIFENTSELLTPYIEQDSVPAEILKLELDAINKLGIKVQTSISNPDLKGFDAVVSVKPNQQSTNWFTPQTKSKHPARLVLEGKNIAELVDVKLSCKEKQLDNKIFNSSYSAITNKEKKVLKAQLDDTPTSSGCLYCDCDRKTDCKLRQYSTEYNIKNSRYAKYSSSSAMLRQKIGGDIWFEEAKCIKCALCVYNSNDGFTFKGRGFDMQICLPEESEKNITKNIVKNCPTGALYIRK